ncbi:MAG TPA: PqqD family protein [Chthoniobacterales bacterium]|nr:PqqD family protein [Chthoniobacterales bacterium]
MRFRVNSPKVIHQIFETEVVVVNLETGVYYSLRESGIDIWRGLVAGLGEQEIVSNLKPMDGGSAVHNFVQALASEDLIVENENAAGTVDEVNIDRPFREPIMEKFTDMQEMLLIDPIHELDESGWPRKPEPM